MTERSYPNRCGGYRRVDGHRPLRVEAEDVIDQRAVRALDPLPDSLAALSCNVVLRRRQLDADRDVGQEDKCAQLAVEIGGLTRSVPSTSIVRRYGGTSPAPSASAA
jgi:hypothetical protein